jgi:hypothetical protein
MFTFFFGDSIPDVLFLILHYLNSTTLAPLALPLGEEMHRKGMLPMLYRHDNGLHSASYQELV